MFHCAGREVQGHFGPTESGAEAAASASWRTSLRRRKSIQRLWAIRNSQGERGRLSSKGVELPVGMKQRVLNDIFAIEDRTGHARTVAVKLRTKVGDGLEKSQIAGFERTGKLIHIALYAPREVRGYGCLLVLFRHPLDDLIRGKAKRVIASATRRNTPIRNTNAIPVA